MFMKLYTVDQAVTEDLAYCITELVGSMDLDALANKIDRYYASGVDGSILLADDKEVLVANEICRRMKAREATLLDELTGYEEEEEPDGLKQLFDEGILK